MSLKKPEELSSKQREKLGEWLRLAVGEALVCVYDATVFGSLSEGLAVTDQRIAKFDGDTVNSIPFGDLAELKVEAGDGALQYVTAAGRLSGRFTVPVAAAGDGIEQLLAPIRARVPEGVVTRSLGAAGGWRFSAATKPVRCQHCGGDRFATDQMTLKTRAVFSDLRVAALECVTCGLLAFFGRTPTVIAE